MAAPKKNTPSLDQVMKALGDPIRMSVVRQLLAVRGQEKACGTFEHEVTKATFSHHMAILESAGVVQARQEGTRKMISLKLDELKKKFPGLIDLIQSAS